MEDTSAELIPEAEAPKPGWPRRLWDLRSGVRVVALALIGAALVSLAQFAVLVQANMGFDALLQGFDNAQSLPNFETVPFSTMLVTVLGLGLSVGLSLWLAGGLGRRVSLADFGLGAFSRTQFWYALLFGIVLAVGRMLLLAPLLAISPEMQEGSEALLQMAFPTDNTLTVIVSVLMVSVLAPVYEEALFRGFLHNWLRNRLPFWSAALLSSAVFGAFHMIPAQMLAAFVFGLGLAWYYEKSGSLWGPIVAHAANNLLAQGLTFIAMLLLQ